MEKRLYFVLGDFFVTAIAGVAAALAAHALTSSWHPLIALPVGFLAGAIAASVVAMVFMPLFGAFEVMLPAILAGVLAGAAGSRTDRPVLVGASIGIAVVVWVYVLTERAGRDQQRSRA